MARNQLEFGMSSAASGPAALFTATAENPRVMLRDFIASGARASCVGSPRGADSDVLELSVPPAYTACPNPFLGAFVAEVGRPYDARVRFHREPHAGEFKVTQRHPVYSFHPYHTKVPPEIIRTLIEHYTDPGDLVLDAFAGSGMTGVAAREAGRHAILVDLSPISTFISSVNTRTHDGAAAAALLNDALDASEEKWGHLYETLEGKTRLAVNYFVWCDVFTCPNCVHEFPFFPHGVIHHGDKVETRDGFPCPACGAELNVRRVERVIAGGRKKKALAWVNAGTGRKRVNREPNKADRELAVRVEEMQPPNWYPSDSVDPSGYSAKLAQLGDKAITDVSRFLSRRNLIVFADLWDRVGRVQDAELRNVCRATLTSIFTVISERQGYFGGGGGMSGNLYMPIVRMEKNVFDSLRRKIKRMQEAEAAKKALTTRVMVSTQSATSLVGIPDASVDFVYTDPPFGANIIYSEMNLVLEGWLKVRTNEDAEAVINLPRRRGFDEYADLMRQCFREYFRVLKPGRWITVEFHNTSAAVWNLIQTAIGEAGFVVAQVGTLDKGSTTILADIRPAAAKYDLLIAAYRPSAELEARFSLKAGTADSAWEFVSQHLDQLPVARVVDGAMQPVTDRQPHMLFDRMVGFHVQRGFQVPLSAAEFHSGLARTYPERDGMFFLPQQVAVYDRERARVAQVRQLELFVTDESSAIAWLRRRLEVAPAPYQELQPEFLRESRGWQRYESPIELLELLKQNFLVYDGRGPVPAQVAAAVRVARPEMRDAADDAQALVAAARDLWYVPNPHQKADLEKLRERELIAEFESYRTTRGALERVRIEAVRAGFKAAYQQQKYDVILAIADRLPDELLQGDAALLMYFDVARGRADG